MSIIVGTWEGLQDQGKMINILSQKQNNNKMLGHSLSSRALKSYILPHMRTLDQGQTQQGNWTLIT
jgi:uncharacterized protein with NRDE domain